MKRNIRKLLIVSTLIVVSVAVSHANADEETIMPPGYTWEYSFTDPTADPDWTISIGGWDTGPAPFGNATGAGVNGVTNFNYNTLWPEDLSGGDDLWVRTVIDLTGYDLSTINWELGVDNAYTLYINGNLAPGSTNGVVPYTYRWEYYGTFPQASLINGVNIIAVALNDWGGATAFDMQISGTPNPVGDDDEGPKASNVTTSREGKVTMEPVPLGTDAIVLAYVHDYDTGEADIASAGYSVNGGPWIEMAATDGAFDESSEFVTANLGQLPVGVHRILVRGIDSHGNVGDAVAAPLVVYELEPRFVAGAGAFDSGPGRYKLDPTLSGVATFGFFSEWEGKGAKPPGETEIIFELGPLNFRSTSCGKLLVVCHV